MRQSVHLGWPAGEAVDHGPAPLVLVSLHRIAVGHSAIKRCDPSRRNSEFRRTGIGTWAPASRRLGLSAADCGLLVGASSQSVYNWEEGKVRPRSQHLDAIAALRSMGKREVAARLTVLKGRT